MLFKIKNKIEKELPKFLALCDRQYKLSKIAPALFSHIKDFISRDGKRIRPILFTIGYLGFTKKPASGLYQSALSVELLHDFLLVHDDIIDKSDTRRGKPSMHRALDNHLNKYQGIKFNGQDLAIVAADVIYALSIQAFLAIKENPKRKEAALRKLIEAVVYTGSGEFIELIYGAENIKEISLEKIYKIYDYKTAYYTFAAPLASAATLAGASKKEIDKLFKYGIFLGRAFQIKDDILGMFGSQNKTGKSAMADLREAKKTILIWYAYHNSDSKNKALIKNMLSKKNSDFKDLLKMRRILIDSGALDFAKKEYSRFIKMARRLNTQSGISPKYKNILNNYFQKTIGLSACARNK